MGLIALHRGPRWSTVPIPSHSGASIGIRLFPERGIQPRTLCLARTSARNPKQGRALARSVNCCRCNCVPQQNPRKEGSHLVEPIA